MRSTVTDYSLFTIHYSLILMQTFRLPNVMFAAGRFGNVVSDDSFLLDACFSFLSNILSICIATKRKNIGAGLRGCTTPFCTSPYPLSCICSTLTETRQKAYGLVVSFRSLSGLTSCRPYANPPPT